MLLDTGLKVDSALNIRLALAGPHLTTMGADRESGKSSELATTVYPQEVLG